MNRRTRLFLSIGIPLLLVIVVVSAFFWQQRASGSGTPTTARITVTPGSVCSTLNKAAPKQLTSMSLALDWTPNTNHTGIYVALAQKWYQAEGIDLHLLPYSASVSPDVLVATGKADVGISATEGIVADAAVGQPVVSIAAIIQHNTSALVSLASSGLTRPRDFDGKTYGGFGAPYESAVVGRDHPERRRQRPLYQYHPERRCNAGVRVAPYRFRVGLRRLGSDPGAALRCAS